jgi:hypothetical protein
MDISSRFFHGPLCAVTRIWLQEACQRQKNRKAMIFND